MNLVTRGSPESYLRLNTNYRRLPNCRITISIRHLFICQQGIGGSPESCLRILFLRQYNEPIRHFHFFIDTTCNWGLSLKCFYNFKRFLACMIFLTTRSVLVFLPGNLSMAWIILVSAFHLSCKFLARL